MAMCIPGRINHSYRHWTPRYLYDRFGVMWFEFKNPDAPWLTKTAVGILDSWLSKEDIGLEWGSGRSTLWLARRVKHLTSVETNEYWFNKIRTEIEEQNLYNISYLYKPDIESGMDSGYVRVVDAFPPGSLFAGKPGRNRLDPAFMS